MSGATRTIYEALQRVRPHEMLLLADELASNAEGVDPERLLASGATMVWVRDLRRLAQAAPQLGAWFAQRRNDVLATVDGLVRPEDEELVTQLGLDAGAVSVSMSAQLTETERDFAHEKFGRELTTIGEVVRASRPQRAGQAAYLADSYDALGRLTPATDALDIGPDVRMLSSLVVSTQILPPLSIGLFGPWGSGKSFLMHQIKLGAVELAARSQELREGETSAYCPKLVTVDFNAWQYAHGVDLWASLVSRVFEGIQEQLGSAEAYQELWQNIRKLSTDVASAQHELDAAKGELRSMAAEGEKNSVADVAQHDPLLKASAATLKTTIDLDPATTQISTLRNHAGAPTAHGGGQVQTRMARSIKVATLPRRRDDRPGSARRLGLPVHGTGRRVAAHHLRAVTGLRKRRPQARAPGAHGRGADPGRRPSPV